VAPERDDANVTAEAGSGVDAADVSAENLVDEDVTTSALDAGDCNSVVNGAPLLQYTLQPGSLPVAHGGSIAPGLYFLTEYNVYANSTAPQVTFRWTLLVATSDIQSVFDIESSPTSRESFSFATSGTTLAYEITCPPASKESFEYTATATELRLYRPYYELVFEKQ